MDSTGRCVSGCRQVGSQVAGGAYDHTDPAPVDPSGVTAPRLTEVIVPTPPSVPTLSRQRSRPRPGLPPLLGGTQIRVVPWVDPVADPHGLHPCSRYVELYWLPVIGPSTTWLLRRLSYGIEVHGEGFQLDLSETARSLGLGERMGKNSPFRRALQRLCTFELARPHGPDALAVRTLIPPPSAPTSVPAAPIPAVQSSPMAERTAVARARADAPSGPAIGAGAGLDGKEQARDRTPTRPLALPPGHRLCCR